MRTLILSAALALGALGIISTPSAEAQGYRGGYHGARYNWSGGYRHGIGHHRPYHSGYHGRYHGHGHHWRHHHGHYPYRAWSSGGYYRPGYSW